MLGAAAGSQSPGGPPADKPRVGWVTGRAAPWIQPAGKHSASPGPAVWAHTRGGGRQSKSRWTKGRQAKGRLGDWAGWPTSRLGRWTGATQQAGTDVALTRAAISGHSTVGPRPAAARLGQEPVAISLSGRVPATARTASAGVAAGVCRDGLTRTILKAKVESLSLPRTLTVIVTTAQNELKDGDPTSRMLSCRRKTSPAFLSPFQQFPAKCRRAHPG